MTDRLENFHPIVIRDAGVEDMAAVQEIYAHHVLHRSASFEETPPDIVEMIGRRAAIVKKGLPYRIAKLDGAIKGFAYAAPYRHRPAYRYTVEDSVYVADGAGGHGLGRMLLEDLIGKCAALGYRQMVAVIGDTANEPSISLHRKLGFRQAGLLTSVGFKFDGWVDSVLMQRPLGPGDDTPPDD